jgi:NAD dependent epimerase/dehydratase family enzyme
MPWIHINDLCRVYLEAIDDPSMNGAYNAVAPQHVTHSEFMAILGKVMKRTVLPVTVPAFLLKIALGEMSEIILKGSRVSSKKIVDSGYVFQYPELEGALEEIIPDF